MNWFTKGVINKNKAAAVVAQNETTADMCEHVSADYSVATNWQSENDSFGVVGKYIFCAECWKKEEERLNAEEVVCTDCRQTVQQKDSIEWKWYDFDRMQGDEPQIICKTCVERDKHKQRVANDNEKRRVELGDDDFDEYTEW